jgi:sec-independent protein translocase protein TatB
MFEVAWSELFLVIIVAIIVIGPKELPGLLRTMGRIVGKLRRTAEEFRRHFDDTIREAGGEDLKRELDQLRAQNPLNEIRNTIEEAAREVTHPVDTAITKPAETGSVDKTPTSEDSNPPVPVPQSDTAPVFDQPLVKTEQCSVDSPRSPSDRDQKN